MTRQTKRKSCLPRLCFESHSTIFKTFVFVCLFGLIGLLFTSIYYDSQSDLADHLKSSGGQSNLVYHHKQTEQNTSPADLKKEKAQPPSHSSSSNAKHVEEKEKLIDRLDKQNIKVIPDEHAQNPGPNTNNHSIRSPEKLFATDSFQNVVRKFFPTDGLQSRELVDIIHKCAPKNHSQATPIHFDSSSFIIEESSLCNGNIFLLIAVHSYSANRHRRDLIRRTWGSFRQIDSYRVLVVFFVGRVEGETEGERAKLLEESDTFRDIVQKDFIEHYRNITYKHVAIMHWLSLHCSKAQYLLKVDDDTFVDVFHVVHFLTMHPLMGFICKSVITKPVRDKKSSMSKWFVTKEEFSGDIYPQYCEGFGYIMLAKHACQLYWCSVYSEFFWIDDVYVTGMLRSKLNIEIEKFWVGHSWDNMLPSYASEKIADIMLLVASHNEIIPELWDSIWKAILRFNIL